MGEVVLTGGGCKSQVLGGGTGWSALEKVTYIAAV